MLTASIVVGIIILLIELVLWRVFVGKIEGICFPGEADHSHFRFFSLIRMRLMIILHTIMILGVLVISTVLLW